MSFESKATETMAMLAENQAYMLGNAIPVQSVGELVSKHEGVQDFVKGHCNTFKVELPYETKTAITGTGAQNDPLTFPTRTGVARAGRRPLMVRSLLTEGVASDAAVEVPVESTYTDNMASQNGENTAFSESDATFTLSFNPVQTIGTYFKVSKQVLTDSSSLDTFLRNTALYKMELEIERQLLLGSGASGELSGMVGSATSYTTASPAFTNEIDILRSALLQVEQSEFQPTGIILNPLDFYSIEIRKVASSDDSYAAGQPRAPGRTLWGVPVILSNKLTAGTFILGDFARMGAVYTREAPTITTGFHDSTNFQENAVTLVIQSRLALVVSQPDALRTGSL